MALPRPSARQRLLCGLLTASLAAALAALWAPWAAADDGVQTAGWSTSDTAGSAVQQASYVATTSQSSSGSTLRWRGASRGVPAVLPASEAARPLTAPSREAAESLSRVQPAQMTAPLNDPFGDPFGDGTPTDSPRLLLANQPDQLPGAGADGQLIPPPSFDEPPRLDGLRAEACPLPEELKRINAITNEIAPTPGEFPQECGLGDGVFEGRCFPMVTYAWKASGLCHKPLYFEEVHLERYGHTTRPLTQPFVSGAHFFGSAIMLPYQMGIDPPWECEYPLGYYRPGNCAPMMVRPFPWSLRGAALQAGAVVGVGAAFFP